MTECSGRKSSAAREMCQKCEFARLERGCHKGREEVATEKRRTSSSPIHRRTYVATARLWSANLAVAIVQLWERHSFRQVALLVLKLEDFTFCARLLSRRQTLRQNSTSIRIPLPLFLTPVHFTETIIRGIGRHHLHSSNKVREFGLFAISTETTNSTALCFLKKYLKIYM